MRPGESSRERLITWAMYLLTIGASAVVLYDSIFWNFGYDQGTFAYGGSAILKGARPYLDFWDIKPPNIFYIYALAFKLFGESVQAIRIFDYLNALLTISLIWLLSLRLFSSSSRGASPQREMKSNGLWWTRLVGMFAAFSYVLCYLNQGFQDTAQAETYALPLLLGAALIVLPRNGQAPGRLSLVISGALIGITCFFKFPLGLFILLPVAICLLQYRRWSAKLISLGFLTVGLLLALGAQMLLLLPGGQLQELWKITREATLAYSRNNFSGSFSVFHNARTAVQMFVGLWLVLGGVGCIVLLWRSDSHRRRNLMLPIGLLIIGAFIGLIIVQLQNKGYTYHYQVMLPWVAILIGVGMATLAFKLQPSGKWKRVGSAVGLAILLFIGTLWSGEKALKQSLRPSEVVQMEGANGYIAGDALSNYVLAKTAPSDHMFIFGFEPYVYWITGRKPATRFLNTIHFKPTYVAADLRHELIDSLTQHPPALIFVEMGDHYTSQGDSFDDSHSTIQKRYPEISELLSTKYLLADTVNDVLAYLLISNQHSVH